MVLRIKALAMADAIGTTPIFHVLHDLESLEDRLDKTGEIDDNAHEKLRIRLTSWRVRIDAGIGW